MHISRWHWPLAGLCVLVATFFYGALTLDPRVPVFDETVYLQHALSLHEHGVFSEHYRVGAPAPAPGAYVGPGYPYFVSLLLPFDDTLRGLAECVVDGRPDCRPGIGIAAPIQLVVAAIAVFLVYAAGMVVFENRVVAGVAASLFLLATEVPVYYANHMLTENLVVPLSFATGLALVLAVRRRSLGWIAAVGVLLGLTALVRPSYFYLGILCLAAGLLAALLVLAARRRAFWLAAAVTFGLAFAATTGPWIARNAVQLDAARFNVGYGQMPLSSRLAYNRMTATEWLAAWIYWLPDFGDQLAADIFGQRQVARLNISNPESFVRAPRSEIREQLRDLPAETDPVGWLVRNEVLAHPIKHLAVSLVMAWQGALVAQYVGIVGLAALVWAALGGLRGRRRRDLMLLAAPPILLLGLQANVSVSIPRYNLPLLLPMLLAVSYAAWRLAAAGRGLLPLPSRHPQRP